MARNSQQPIQPVNEVVEDEFPPIDDDVDVVEDDDLVLDGPEPGKITQLDAGTDMGPRPDNTENMGDGRFDRQRLPHEPQPDDTTNTKNYMGAGDRTLAEWQQLGDEVDVEPIIVRDDAPAERMFKLRVMEDIGPVYYGPGTEFEIHLLKGVLYQVPARVEEYLRARGKIWSYA